MRKHGRKLQSCWCLRSNPPFPFCHFVLSPAHLDFLFSPTNLPLNSGQECSVQLLWKMSIEKEKNTQNDLVCFVINFPLGDLNIRNPRFRRNSFVLMCLVSHFLSFFPSSAMWHSFCSQNETKEECKCTHRFSTRNMVSVNEHLSPH